MLSFYCVRIPPKMIKLRKDKGCSIYSHARDKYRKRPIFSFAIRCSTFCTHSFINYIERRIYEMVRIRITKIIFIFLEPEIYRYRFTYGETLILNFPASNCRFIGDNVIAFRNRWNSVPSGNLSHSNLNVFPKIFLGWKVFHCSSWKRCT